MKGAAYRKLVGGRTLIELNNPQYTLITHNKIIFIERAARAFPHYDVYAWVDFGHFRNADSIKGIELFNPDLLRDLTTVRLDIATSTLTASEIPTAIDVLVEDPLIIRACAFFVPRAVVSTFVTLYKQMLDAYQAQGIANDEQALLLECIKAQPHLFSFTHTTNWFRLLHAFLR